MPSFARPGLCYPVCMTPVRAKLDQRILVLFGVTAASLAGLLLLPSIPQDQHYHQFADQRALLGIPNFWNVVSNIPFIAIGAIGLRRFRNDPATVVLFLGFLLTGIGSSYYHWDPNDGTLFWDRLPMTLAFAAIVALAVEAQFFPFLALVLLFLLYPPRYTGTYYWIIAAALYALAKLFEFSDDAIYSAGYLLSGHTLKHLAAAAACFMILRYFQNRQPVLDGEGASPPRGV